MYSIGCQVANIAYVGCVVPGPMAMMIGGVTCARNVGLSLAPALSPLACIAMRIDTMSLYVEKLQQAQSVAQLTPPASGWEALLLCYGVAIIGTTIAFLLWEFWWLRAPSSQGSKKKEKD